VDKEHDETYQLSLGLNAQFSENWSGYFNACFNAYRSNNANSDTSLYNYTFTSVSLGTQWTY
jgi:hypothetical protein